MPVEQKPSHKKRPTADELAELTTAYREVATGEDEDTVERRRQLLKEIRRSRHEDRHPDEPQVEIDMPKAADGSLFKINDIPFVGKVTVPQCVAQQLLWMVDNNYRVDKERLREKRYGFDLDRGILGERARLIAQD
jgi:hypothetical protein